MGRSVQTSHRLFPGNLFFSLMGERLHDSFRVKNFGSNLDGSSSDEVMAPWKMKLGFKL